MYASIIAYEHRPVTQSTPSPEGLPLLHIVVVAGLIMLIGYIAASRVIFLLPPVQVLAFVIDKTGNDFGEGFAILVVIVVALPVVEALLALGVRVAQSSSGKTRR